MTILTPALSVGSTIAAPSDQIQQDAVFTKIIWRLMPMIFVAYLLAYLDRINVGYAQLQMKTALDFSDAVYGFGAGLFFLSYLVLEVPSNMLFERFGARMASAACPWICRRSTCRSICSRRGRITSCPGNRRFARKI
jgi:sugar phosphate permease